MWGELMATCDKCGGQEVGDLEAHNAEKHSEG